MSRAIHTLTQYAFMALCSVKAQGELYFYLYRQTNTRTTLQSRL